MRTRIAACILTLLPALAVAAPQQAQTRPQGGSHDHEHSHQPTSTHGFSDVERWVAVFDDPNRAAWQKPALVASALGLEQDMAVADIGAGTGYFERFFAEAVGPAGKVYAVDIEPGMVAHLAERARREKTPNVTPLLAAADDPRLPEAAVDVIFICDTYHHIGDRIDYIARLGRALRPGGRVAVVDFVKKDLPVGPPPRHKLSREAVVAEFAEAGWVLAREESDLLPYQYFLIFRPAPAGP